MRDALVGKLRDVDEPLDPFVDLRKRPEGRQFGDAPRDDLPDLVVLLRPASRAPPGAASG